MFSTGVVYTQPPALASRSSLPPLFPDTKLPYHISEPSGSTKRRSRSLQFAQISVTLKSTPSAVPPLSTIAYSISESSPVPNPSQIAKYPTDSNSQWS